MRKTIFGLLNIFYPNKTKIDHEDNQAKINIDIIYQEYLQEMRRYRDYELISSTWYTAILIAITGFVINVIYGKDFPQLKYLLNSNLSVQVLTSLATTILGCASVYSIRWANLRYEELKYFVFTVKADLIPKDYKFDPKPRKFKPVCLIYCVHFLILVIINYVIFSRLIYVICVFLIYLLVLSLIFVLIFSCCLRWDKRWDPKEKKEQNPS